MSFYIESVNFKPYPVAFANFRQAQSQPIGAYIYRLGKELQVLARGTAPRKTGRLANSIRVSYFRGVSNPHVTIGSNVRYAYMVHEGTRPHLIRPKDARVLRFKHNGRVVYAQRVMHPGTPRTEFLSKHLRTVVG